MTKEPIMPTGDDRVRMEGHDAIIEQIADQFLSADFRRIIGQTKIGGPTGKEYHPDVNMLADVQTGVLVMDEKTIGGGEDGTMIERSKRIQSGENVGLIVIDVLNDWRIDNVRRSDDISEEGFANILAAVEIANRKRREGK